MSKVKKIADFKGIHCELEKREQLQDIAENFSCASKPDSYDELILDGIYLEESCAMVKLCEILNIKKGSDQAASLADADWIVFYA